MKRALGKKAIIFQKTLNKEIAPPKKTPYLTQKELHQCFIFNYEILYTYILQKETKAS